MKLLHCVQGIGVRPGEILFDKWLDHLLFKTLLKIYDVIRNAENGRDETGIVDVVERAAAPDCASFRNRDRADAAGSKAAWS